MLNRAALIARPRKPYLDWAAGLDDSGISPSDDDEGTVYLVPSFEIREEGREVLKDIYLEVFERELEAWHTDKSAWPRDRISDSLSSITMDIYIGHLGSYEANFLRGIGPFHKTILRRYCSLE